ncbi:hypothetical protein B0H67DRAFT_595143 [Lasiosphaeris hirsuta]|uniref:Uncharacterized protein n=1 Tax=Lasiosphaeris hirsuta TaxID=260670 RepID=A0AA39ZSG7_9PEZI|nr:hypothetical protein B0H67DRAFT_595143 [Lasiosphaeris hirsuta]
MDNPMYGYEAGGKDEESCSVEMGEEEAIVVQGLTVDTVDEVDNANPHIAYHGGLSSEEMKYQEMGFVGAPKVLLADHMKKMRTWLLRIRRMAEAHERHAEGVYSATNESLHHAILRTLICDDDSMTFPASRKTLIDLDLCTFEALCSSELEMQMPSASLISRVAGISEIELRLKSQRAYGLIARRTKGRQFAMSKGGLIMIVPSQAKTGDVIVVFRGARVPYLLRPVPGIRERKYTLIGEAYVHGIMQGECFPESPDIASLGHCESETFCIA